MTESKFVENAEKIKTSADLLNYYRNLFHCESETTERGIVARAINDILPEYARQKAEIESLKEAIVFKNLTPIEYRVRKEHDEKHIHIINGLEAEIERLKADKVIAERHEKDARELFKNAVSEIEQWKEEANKYQNLWCEVESDLQKAKSEAVKEFAEELEKYKCLRHDGHEFVDVIRIRLLLEEMVGELNE